MNSLFMKNHNIIISWYLVVVSIFVLWQKNIMIHQCIGVSLQHHAVIFSSSSCLAYCSTLSASLFLPICRSVCLWKQACSQGPYSFSGCMYNGHFVTFQSSGPKIETRVLNIVFCSLGLFFFTVHLCSLRLWKIAKFLKSSSSSSVAGATLIFLVFAKLRKKTFRYKWIIKFLGRLKERHSQFVTLNN